MLFKKAYTNKLIESISKKSLKLEQILLDKCLSISIRNESKELLDYLFDDETYKIVIDYALFDRKPPKEFEEFQSHQLNVNSGNLLSYPSVRVKERISSIKGEKDEPLLLEKFKEFLKNKEYNQNPLCAGNFQRIFMNIVRNPGANLKTFFNDSFSDELITFICENILILSYRELLASIFEDLSNDLGTEKTAKILKQVLQYAIFYSYMTLEKSPRKNIFLDEYRKESTFFDNNKPINKNKKQIPNAKFSDDENDDYRKKSIFIIKQLKKKEIFPKNYKPSDSQNAIDFEEANMKAYFFVSSIYNSFQSNNDFIHLHNIEIIELVLICGIFSDRNSLSSMVSFKILEALYYGNLDEGYEIEPYQTPEFINLINSYAVYLNYNKPTLNLLEINAFPIFWNCRYKIDDKNSPPCFINPDPVLGIRSPKVCCNEITPLLLLRPYLFYDPPISSRLIFSYLKIFNFLSQKRKILTGNNVKNIEKYEKNVQDQIRWIDAIVYEFIQRKFLFEINGNKQFVTFYEALNEIIPYFPQEEDEEEEEVTVKPSRASFNGSAFEICRTLQSSSFFIINNEVSELLFDIHNDNFKNGKPNPVIDVFQYESRDIDVNKKPLDTISKIKVDENDDDDEDDEDEL